MEVFAAGPVGCGRNKPLRVPEKINIRILRRGWRETQVVQLHENFVTRRNGRTWRDRHFADIGSQNVKLRHVRGAGTADLVFAVSGDIENAVEWRDSRDPQRRLRGINSGAAVLMNVHRVTRQRADDVV